MQASRECSGKESGKWRMETGNETRGGHLLLFPFPLSTFHFPLFSPYSCPVPELATLQRSGPIATLTLERADARNALSLDLLGALHARLDELVGSGGGGGG